MAAVAAAVVNRGILRDSLASSLVREFLLSVVWQRLHPLPPAHIFTEPHIY